MVVKDLLDNRPRYFVAADRWLRLLCIIGLAVVTTIVITTSPTTTDEPSYEKQHIVVAKRFFLRTLIKCQLWHPG